MAQNSSATSIPWGTHNGKPVELYELKGNAGSILKVCTYGATLVSWQVPGRFGQDDDILLGFDDLESYEEHNTYIGCAVGRVASRIANGKFALPADDCTPGCAIPGLFATSGMKTHKLPQNNATACHHGGPVGFNSHVWEVVDSTSTSIWLRDVSPHLDQGFPGKLTVIVKYEIVSTSDGGTALAYHFTAETDRKTVVNLTNHLYFNLAGIGPNMQNKLYNHSVSIAADTFVPIDEDNIPIGGLRSVEGTALDFRRPTKIGARVDKDDEQLHFASGIDHNMVLRDVPGLPPGLCGGTRSLGVEGFGDDGKLMRTRAPDAVVNDRWSGRQLEMFTSEPAVHFYTGNYLGEDPMGKSGVPIDRRSGFCLEAQHFTDSPNQRSFPSVVLRPGQIWETSTVFWLTRNQVPLSVSACGGCFDGIRNKFLS